MNQAFVGWSEPSPKGPFRSYSFELSRQDEWDFGGLRTRAASAVEASGTFRNKWSLEGELVFEQVTDTRALRGGPALRWHDFFEAVAAAPAATSRDAHRSAAGVEHAWSVDDDSRSTELEGQLNLRLSNRLSLSGRVSYERLTDNLQYVATADAESRRAGVRARPHRPGHVGLHVPGEPRALARPDAAVLREPLRRHRAATPSSSARPTRSPRTTRTASTCTDRTRSRRARAAGTSSTRRRAPATRSRTPTSASASSARTWWRAGSTSRARRSTWSGRRAAPAAVAAWESSFQSNWNELWQREPRQRVPGEDQLLVLAVGGVRS